VRIVVLGSGGMGQYAARTAANLPFVDDLVVADLNLAAPEACATPRGPNARGVAVDVLDEPALVSLLTGAAAVLNTVGPFFRLGPPVLRAAIKAKTNYLDINDDWESTEAMLALHEKARAAGITAIIGMGASPGISNLMAVLAMRELDEVEEVIAGFDLDAAMPEERGDKPAAATIHGLHQLTGMIRVFTDGSFTDAKPMQRIRFDYPGLGEQVGWTMGHPEAITFPKSHPDLRTARVVMTMGNGNRIALTIVAALINAGLLSLERAAGLVERIEGVGAPVKTPGDYVGDMIDGGRGLPPLFAVARGRRQGAPASAAAALLSAPAVGMGGATGVPLATALGIARPDTEMQRGVFAPESAIDPRAFFEALAPLCDPPYTDVDELVLITRSWEPVRVPDVLSSRRR
jgi:saccharopine dehydrogenase-like NADP-dependent oxidoreductase